MENEKELREGLTKVVGGRRAEEIVRELREDREPQAITKRAIIEEKPVLPLSAQEIAAIQANLGITLSAPTPDQKK